MIFAEHLDKVCWCAGRKPIVIHTFLVVSLQKAEGIEQVGGWPREVIAVILLCKDFDCPLTCPSVIGGQPVDVVHSMSKHFLLGDAAYCGKIRVHGNVCQVVQFAEDADLRELGDAGEEQEMQVGVGIFQRRVEVAHDVAKLGQGLVLVNHVKHGRVVFVDKDDHFLACLFVDVANEVLKSQIWVGFVGGETKTLLVIFQYGKQITLQLVFLHVFA